jgi:nucleotide-binding universal stress UspA family protein
LNIPLVVVTVNEIGRTSLEVLSLAKRYLNRRNVNATFINKVGSVGDSILDTAQEYECDLIIMGGYGRSPVLEVMLGSTVDPILQASQIPVLICR